MKFLLPKQPAFFNSFKELDENISEIAALFSEFSKNFRDFDDYRQKSKEIEDRADGITHAIIVKLNQSFIVPFDHDDIHKLAMEMDDVVDLIDETINDIYLFGIEEKEDFIDDFAKLISSAAESLHKLIAECFNKQKHTVKLRELIRRLHELEDEGDEVYQTSLRKIFSEEKDPVLIIKWKDILDGLEEIMDQFQQVSNVVESIAVKEG